MHVLGRRGRELVCSAREVEQRGETVVGGVFGLELLAGNASFTRKKGSQSLKGPLLHGHASDSSVGCFKDRKRGAPKAVVPSICRGGFQVRAFCISLHHNVKINWRCVKEAVSRRLVLLLAVEINLPVTTDNDVSWFNGLESKKWVCLLY